MKVILNGVSKGENGENLPLTSLSYESGAVTLVVVETAKRPTVLALLAAGRMAPDAGTITFDGLPDPAALRARSAIVDAPDVSEPVGDLKLTAVVQEELMFAGRPSSRGATLTTIDELDAAQYARHEMQNVPPAVRLHILAELAVSRPGIEAVVLTSPDRHGGDPFGWWAVASDLATRGLAVLVITSEASIDVVRDVSATFESDRLAELERKAAARRREEAEEAAEAAAAVTAGVPADAAANSETPAAIVAAEATHTAKTSGAVTTIAGRMPAATEIPPAADPSPSIPDTSPTPHAHTHPHAIPLPEPAAAQPKDHA